MAVQAQVASPRVLVDRIPGTWIRDVAAVIGYAAFVGLLAQVAIPLPFTPVPITGQTFGVLLGGMALGWRRGILGMLLYVIAGMAGVPWFAQGHSGVPLASFGYLLSYPITSAVVGKLASRGWDRSPHMSLLTMAIGSAVIYLLGVTWLAVDLHIGAWKALELGMFPFLIGDFIKALVAAGLLPATWKFANR